MKKQVLSTAVLLLTLTILLPSASFASGQVRGPKGPPSEAIEACEGKSAGDNVEFTGRRGETLEATCQEKDGQLAAVPDNKPEGSDRRPQGPPPEAIEACEDKSAGDSIEFIDRRGETQEATCEEKDGQLAAVPVGGRRGK